MEAECGGKNKLLTHPEATSNDIDPLLQNKMLGSSSSLSPSSASSFSSNSYPLELNSGEEEALDNSFTKSEQDGLRLWRPESISLQDAQTPEWSMVSASPRSGTGFSASPTKSPPIQMMWRPTGYDPNRIPSSVFTTSKPATPMEWSVASNESLFSIHMGNNSFSREQYAIMFGKSGELTKLDEWNNSPSGLHTVTEAKSNDLNNLPSSPPTVIEPPAENDRISANMEEYFGVKEEANKTLTVVSKEERPSAEGVHLDGRGMTPADGGRTSVSTPRLSNESGNSCSSFAFPILACEGGSVKGVPEKPLSQPQPQPQPRPLSQPQPQPQSPEATPKATTKAGDFNWLHCFQCSQFCTLCIR